jgi:hypothetical protein
MESIRNSMDPRAKEKHQEEHEDSKKEREAKATSHCIKNHKITKSNQAEELKVMMKNNVYMQAL